MFRCVMPRPLWSTALPAMRHPDRTTSDRGEMTATAPAPRARRGFRRRFQRAVRAAGPGDGTPHALRATHATWVADSHGVLVAARRLWHSTASVTTRHYARPVDARDAEVARHLDQLGTGTARRSGTQRARRPRKGGK
jgi:integrase